MTIKNAYHFLLEKVGTVNTRVGIARHTDMVKLPVEYMRQPEWFFCGPTCLAMGLGFFGVLKSPYELAFHAATNEAVGTTHEGMVRAAQRAGMETVERYDATIEELFETVKAGSPVITYLFMPEYEQGEYGEADQMHYMVVTGYTKHAVVLHDPEIDSGQPDVIMPIAEFTKRWRSERSSDESWMMAMVPNKTAIEFPTQIAEYATYTNPQLA